MKRISTIGVLLELLLAAALSVPSPPGLGEQPAASQQPIAAPRPALDPGRADIARHSKIAGGTDADPDDFPWIAAIGELGVDGEVSSYCSGTLIDAQWLVSAAHCHVLEGHYALLGRSDLSTSSGQRVKIVKVIVHPDYRWLDLDHDLVLLKLQHPQAIHPVDLVDAKETAVHRADAIRIAGWGLLGESRYEQPNKLQSADVGVYSQQACTANYARIGTPITDYMFCAHGTTKDLAGICTGDSGGPIVAFDAVARRTVLIGVISKGQGCSQYGFPGVYARLSLLKDWILKCEAEPTPVECLPNPSPQATVWTNANPHPAPSCSWPAIDIVEQSLDVLSGEALSFKVKPATRSLVASVEIRVNSVLAKMLSGDAIKPPDHNGWVGFEIPYLVEGSDNDSLTLPGGLQSEVEIRATGSDGTSCTAVTRVITKSPHTFAILVGINKYPKARVELHYARQDAEKMADYLRANFPSLDRDNLMLLTDSWPDQTPDPYTDIRLPADRDSILRALARVMRKVDKNGAILFYFSGHGFANPDFPESHYLLAENSSLKEDNNMLAMHEVVARMAKAPGERKIIILDACFSDYVLAGYSNDSTHRARSLGGAVNNAGLESFVRDKLYAMTSSTGKEPSYEYEAPFEHGIFTYYLLNATGNPGPVSGVITIAQAFDYVTRAVQAQLPKLMPGAMQTPNHWIFDHADDLVWMHGGAP
jgi:hypothetical protein